MKVVWQGKVNKINFENWIKKKIFHLLSGTDCIGGNRKAMVIAIWEKSIKRKIRRMVNNSKDDKIYLYKKNLKF